MVELHVFVLEYFREHRGTREKTHFYMHVCIQAIVNACTFISTAMSYRYSMIIAKKVIIGDHWRNQSNWNLWD